MRCLSASTPAAISLKVDIGCGCNRPSASARAGSRTSSTSTTATVLGSATGSTRRRRLRSGADPPAPGHPLELRQGDAHRGSGPLEPETDHEQQDDADRDRELRPAVESGIGGEHGEQRCDHQAPGRGPRPDPRPHQLLAVAVLLDGRSNLDPAEGTGPQIQVPAVEGAAAADVAAPGRQQRPGGSGRRPAVRARIRSTPRPCADAARPRRVAAAGARGRGRCAAARPAWPRGWSR